MNNIHQATAADGISRAPRKRYIHISESFGATELSPDELRTYLKNPTGILLGIWGPVRSREDLFFLYPSDVATAMGIGQVTA